MEGLTIPLCPRFSITLPPPTPVKPHRLPRKDKGEATCVPKEQDEQTMPLWAHLSPGNRGPSRSVPAILGGGPTRLP